MAKEFLVSINIKGSSFSVISKLRVKIFCSMTAVFVLVTDYDSHRNVGPSIILIAGLDCNLNNRITLNEVDIVYKLDWSSQAIMT